jgi:hypothetical protein
MPSNLAGPQTTLGTFGNARMQLSEIKQIYLGCYDCDRLQGGSCENMKKACTHHLELLKENPFPEG